MTHSESSQHGRRRMWIRGGIALAVLAAVAVFLHFQIRGPLHYTDGAGVDVLATQVTLRHVLWDRPAALVEPINSSRDEFEPFVNATGDVLLLTRGRPREDSNLFIARRVDGEWTAPEPIVELNTEDNELGGVLSADGGIIYFYSDRPGGQGGYDLWAALRDGEKWGEPFNLGPKINGPYNEYSPGFSPDGTLLYFSSNRPPVSEKPRRGAWSATLRENLYKHDYDIFECQWIPAQPTAGGAASQPATRKAGPPGGAWTPPARVDELCSSADDGTPCFSPSGQFVYFASDRSGGHGGFDVYRSRLRGGKFQPPENLGAPINSASDELDPAVWQEGFQLTFASNRGDGRVFNLFFSRTREVFPEHRSPAWAVAIGSFLKEYLFRILMATLVSVALGLLIWALVTYWRRIPRMIKCGAVSAIAILLFLVGTGFIGLVRDALTRELEPKKPYLIDLAGLSESQIRYELRMQQAKLARIKPKAVEVGRVNAELPTVEKKDTQVTPHPTQLRRIQETPPEVKLAETPKPLPKLVEPPTEIDPIEQFTPASVLPVERVRPRETAATKVTAESAEVRRRLAELPKIQLTMADQRIEVRPDLRRQTVEPPPDVKLTDTPKPVQQRDRPKPDAKVIEHFTQADQLAVERVQRRETVEAHAKPEAAEVRRTMARLPEVRISPADQKVEARPDLRARQVVQPSSASQQPRAEVQVRLTEARTEAQPRQSQQIAVNLHAAKVATQQPRLEPVALAQQQQVQRTRVAEQAVEVRNVRNTRQVNVQPTRMTPETPRVRVAEAAQVTVAQVRRPTEARAAAEHVDPSPLKVEWAAPVSLEQPQATAGRVQLAHVMMKVPDAQVRRAGGRHNPNVTLPKPAPAMFAGSSAIDPLAGAVSAAKAVQRTEVGGPRAASASVQLANLPQLARREQAAPDVKAEQARFIVDRSKMTTTVSPTVHVARAQRSADVRLVDSPAPRTPVAAAEGLPDAPVTLAAQVKTGTQAASVVAKMSADVKVAADYVPVTASAARPTVGPTSARVARSQQRRQAVEASVQRQQPTTRPVDTRQTQIVLASAAQGAASAPRTAETLSRTQAASAAVRVEARVEVAAVTAPAGAAQPQPAAGPVGMPTGRIRSAVPAVTAARMQAGPVAVSASAHRDMTRQIEPAAARASAPQAASVRVRTVARAHRLDAGFMELAVATSTVARSRRTERATASAQSVAAVRQTVSRGNLIPMHLASDTGVLDPAEPRRVRGVAKSTAPPMIARPTTPIPLMKAQHAHASNAKAADVGVNVRLDVPRQERLVSAPLIPRQEERLREAALRQFGGTDETEKAVGNGLAYLSKLQQKKGHWTGGKSRADSALTGLALLSFLGRGHTHQKDNPYRENIGKALVWLRRIQKPNGDLRYRGRMYSHAIATIALCEAYAVTGDPAIEQPARKAIAYIIKSQAPKNWGWRYNPRQRGDTSVVGWCAMALKSAEMAGIKVPASAWENTSGFLDKVSAGRHRGHYGYTAPTTRKPALTCEGLFVRLLMGESPETKRNQESIAVAMKYLPSTRGRRNFYLYYYATLALHYANVKQWPKWNKALQDALLKTQVAKGKYAGSWNNNTQWGVHGGRVYSTAMAVLMLEAYYRYLPMYRHGGKDNVAAGEEPPADKPE